MPPVGVANRLPFDKPLQVTLVTCVARVMVQDGSFIVTEPDVVQFFESVTVNVYMPLGKFP